MRVSSSELGPHISVFFALAILMTIPVGAAGLPAIEPDQWPLPDNFGRMEEWLYRGEAPGPDQLRSLAGLGVATIIDLRHPAERGYGSLVRQLGMDYVHIPMRPRSVPTEEQLQQFLSLLETEERRPLYVHCRKGKHRAGLLLALYRVLGQGASPEDAFAEMQVYGFGRGHHRMVTYFHHRCDAAEPAAEK